MTDSMDIILVQYKLNRTGHITYYTMKAFYTAAAFVHITLTQHSITIFYRHFRMDSDNFYFSRNMRLK